MVDYTKVYNPSFHAFFEVAFFDPAFLFRKTMGDELKRGPSMRWLTVTPPDQPDLEIALMAISEGMMFTKESAGQMRDLVSQGTFGFGVFQCNDIYATYEELKRKGVVFTKAPTKEFYGVEALFKDDSGNWFSLGEKPKTES